MGVADLGDAFHLLRLEPDIQKYQGIFPID